MSSPCLCGATDCRRCFPGNFRDGRYRYAECEKCGEEFEPEDGERVCEDCEQRQRDAEEEEG